MSAYFLPSDILLPDFAAVNGTAWATIACDQFTGEPAYWNTLDERVGDAPSTLRLILPEAFFGANRGTRARHWSEYGVLSSQCAGAP